MSTAIVAGLVAPIRNDLKVSIVPASVRVLSVRVDCVDKDSAVAEIEKLVEVGGAHLVATVNPEFVMRARKDRAFAAVLEKADLCLPDGVGVVWAARRQGCDLRHQVAGVDLVEPIAAVCARRGFRLFLLGAGPGVAAELASNLRDTHPGLEVAAHAGSPDPVDDVETVHRIHDHHAQVLLIAYGAPAQELWFDRLKERLGVSVAVGVGGSFDYLTGRVPRAPAWMRSAGLEWLGRLARQPWRVRRMAVLPVYAIKVLRSPK
jgi:N-acetylglucosaminyldiphosphoundecaprenol N-acetyl-beta-D-mannosaminyltransferase